MLCGAVILLLLTSSTVISKRSGLSKDNCVTDIIEVWSNSVFISDIYRCLQEYWPIQSGGSWHLCCVHSCFVLIQWSNQGEWKYTQLLTLLYTLFLLSSVNYLIILWIFMCHLCNIDGRVRLFPCCIFNTCQLVSLLCLQFEWYSMSMFESS